MNKSNDETRKKMEKEGIHYRKKPVLIRAFRTPKELTIETLEGTMKAEPGDWIIEGIAGELYPCKPGIFASTYRRGVPEGE